MRTENELPDPQRGFKIGVCILAIVITILVSYYLAG